MALPFRRRAKHHRGQQWASRLRVRDTQSRVAVALLGATLRQGAGAQELRGIARRSAARAHDRAVVVCRRKAEIGLTGNYWSIHLPHLDTHLTPLWSTFSQNGSL